MHILIFANLKERLVLQQIMDWSKRTHIRFQMVFVNDEKNVKRMVAANGNNLIIVLNDAKTVKILKKMKKRCIVVKDDWYKGTKSLCK